MLRSIRPSWALFSSSASSESIGISTPTCVVGSWFTHIEQQLQIQTITWISVLRQALLCCVQCVDVSSSRLCGFTFIFMLLRARWTCSGSRITERLSRGLINDFGARSWARRWPTDFFQRFTARAWPEVMTMSPDASSRLSAMMLPLQK